VKTCSGAIATSEYENQHEAKSTNKIKRKTYEGILMRISKHHMWGIPMYKIAARVIKRIPGKKAELKTQELN
jgi:UDP-galactopyranose mutase